MEKMQIIVSDFDSYNRISKESGLSGKISTQSILELIHYAYPELSIDIY